MTSCTGAGLRAGTTALTNSSIAAFLRFTGSPIRKPLKLRAAPGLPTFTIAQKIQEGVEAKKILLQYCSFPEVHCLAHQEAVEAQIRAWLADLYHGRLPAAFVDRLLDSRLDTLGCVFYPHGFSEARSLTLNKLVHWFFLVDDVFDDPHLLGHNYKAACAFAFRQFTAMFGDDVTAMVAVGLADLGDVNDSSAQSDRNSIIKVADSTTVQESLEQAVRLANTQQDLVIEVGMQWAEEMRLLGMSFRQLERLREAVAEYLAGMVGMVRLRQEKQLPSLEEYILLRRMDGAEKLASLGCEFDVGIELDCETLKHPLIKELHAATANQLLWLNDLLSFSCEYHNKDYVSLLPVLHYNNVTRRSTLEATGTRAAHVVEDFQDARREAQAMIKAVDKERVRLAKEIAAWKPDLQSYVKATHCVISGLTFWTLWSPRYQKQEPTLL